MPRRFGAIPRRKSTRARFEPPKPINIKAVSYNPGELFEAYNWASINTNLALRLAVSWYTENTPLLLMSHPLDASGQKSFDRAGKCRMQATGTSLAAEQEQSWRSALRIYEKIWSCPELPKMEQALANVSATIPPSVAGIKTVLDTLNATFLTFGITFSITYEHDRHIAGTEILLPIKALQNLVGQSLLKTLLAEAVTVAKVTSIVTVDGEQTMDGNVFMEKLPLALDAVYDWAAKDNKSMGRSVGKVPAAPKAPKTPALDANGNPVPKAPAGPRKPAVKIHNGTVLTVLTNPGYKGKRGQLLNTIVSGMRFDEYVIALAPLNFKETDIRSFLKFYVDTGNVSLS